MQPFREQRPTNALTPGALLLMFFGVVLALQDVQWQLVSMASFHAGVSLTAVALCIHLCRRHRAWRLELLVLVPAHGVFAACPRTDRDGPRGRQKNTTTHNIPITPR